MAADRPSAFLMSERPSVRRTSVERSSGFSSSRSSSATSSSSTPVRPACRKTAAVTDASK